MTRKEAILELEMLACDRNRQRLEEKFKRCPEARKLSELLGAAVLGRQGYWRRIPREDSLPVPPSLVHPG
jgi:hypothetical protein